MLITGVHNVTLKTKSYDATLETKIVSKRLHNNTMDRDYNALSSR